MLLYQKHNTVGNLSIEHSLHFTKGIRPGAFYSMIENRPYVPWTLRVVFLLKLLLLRFETLTLVLLLHRAAAALFIFNDTLNPVVKGLKVKPATCKYRLFSVKITLKKGLRV